MHFCGIKDDAKYKIYKFCKVVSFLKINLRNANKIAKKNNCSQRFRA